MVAEHCMAIADTDDVVTTGSVGCIVFALLLRRPRSLLAIHPGAAANALCKLKVAAIRHVTLGEFRVLLAGGVEAATVYARLRDAVDAPTRVYWDARPEDLADGLFCCGVFERSHRAFRARLAQVPGARETIARMFEADQLADQLGRFEALVALDGFDAAYRDAFAWEVAMRSGAAPGNVPRYADEPATYSNRYLGTLRRSLGRTLARDNFYLRYLLTGELDERCGPPYLRPEGFAALGELVDRVRFVEQDLLAALRASPAGTFDKAYLLTLAACTDDDRDQVIVELARVLRTGGRWAGKEHPLARPRGAMCDALPLRAAPELIEEATRIDRFPRAAVRRIEIRS